MFLLYSLSHYNISALLQKEKNLLCVIKLSTLVQAQIHTTFHSFTQISQIFHNKYIFYDKK